MLNQNKQQPAPVNSLLAEALARLALNQRTAQAVAASRAPMNHQTLAMSVLPELQPAPPPNSRETNQPHSWKKFDPYLEALKRNREPQPQDGMAYLIEQALRKYFERPPEISPTRSFPEGIRENTPSQTPLQQQPQLQQPQPNPLQPMPDTPPVPQQRGRIGPAVLEALMARNAGAPERIDPQVWQYLTDEERALWQTS